jgi:hypothetical protein
MRKFEEYTLSNFTSEKLSVLRNGYLEWDGEKWLTNMHSLIRLNNPRLKVPRSSHPGIDIGALMHKDLVPYREIDNKDIITYDPSITGKMDIRAENDKFVTIDNDMFGKMCKMNDNDKFYFLIRSQYMMYLYTNDYKFEGFILGIRE